jgi:hypothetical protein
MKVKVLWLRCKPQLHNQKVVFPPVKVAIKVTRKLSLLIILHTSVRLPEMRTIKAIERVV